ncbi:hypothetical protein BT96DRAFT_821493 [Gymnopus androsaceus JB14]|uniref:Ubiquitin-like domain-containing protein n=1 Tax=Gymnopus androsaceus JB14 TaxID=1447944 RepID=A0A6A4HPR1_9AGAR|nr:hypothetical protein BT96DRAFT_821493 [Gymnopus androsaceus JB14]
MALEENSEQEAQPEAEAEVEVEEGNVEQIQAIPQTPIVSISFLLISGKRRVMTFEPETTVGRVKELVWNSWPTGQDWQEDRPPTPSHLRILHLGKILQDEDTLKGVYSPPTSPPSPTPVPTIVHLAIRPTGPGIPNPGDSADLEKRKSKIATRLVARFSSVGEPTSPVTVTPTVGAGDSSAPPQNEDSPGCTCCVVC